MFINKKFLQHHIYFELERTHNTLSWKGPTLLLPLAADKKALKLLVYCQNRNANHIYK